MATLNVLDVVGNALHASLFIPYSELPKHLANQPLEVAGNWNKIIQVSRPKNTNAHNCHWNKGGVLFELDADSFNIPRGTYKLENLAVKINGQNIIVTGITDSTLESRGIKLTNNKDVDVPYYLKAPKAIPGQQLEIPPKTIFKINCKISFRPTQGLVIYFDKSTADIEFPELYVLFVKDKNKYRIVLTNNASGFKIRKNSANNTREIVLSGKNCLAVFGVVQPIVELTEYELVFVKSADSNVIWSKFEPSGFLDGTSDKNQEILEFLDQIRQLNAMATVLKTRGVTLEQLVIIDGKIHFAEVTTSVQTIDHGYAVEKTTRTLRYPLTKM